MEETTSNTKKESSGSSWLKKLFGWIRKSGCLPYVDFEDKGGGITCNPNWFPGDNPKEDNGTKH